MEEDVRNLKELLDVFYKEKDTTWITIHTPQIKNIENILKELDRLQKENEELMEIRISASAHNKIEQLLIENKELKERNEYLVKHKAKLEKELYESNEDYIPKSVIQDKIDVLEKIQKEFKNNEELRIKIITYKELLNKGE